MPKKKTKRKGKRKRKFTKKYGGKKKKAVKVNISPREYKAFGLKCKLCNNDKFYVSNSMLRGGRWASFFKTEWLFDKKAKIAICDRCSHIHWFKDRGAVKEVK
jgi:hypothetical protein